MIHAASAIKKQIAVFKAPFPTMLLPPANKRTGMKRNVTTELMNSINLFVKRNLEETARTIQGYLEKADAHIEMIKKRLAYCKKSGTGRRSSGGRSCT